MATVFYVDPGGTRIRAQDGKFDSRNRYLAKTAAAGAVGIAAGQTIESQVVSWTGASPAVTQFGIAYRQSLNGYVKQRTSSAPWGGTFPTLGFNAAAHLVDVEHGTASKGLHYSGGNLVVADEDGKVALSTALPMFLVTDRKTGTYSVPTRSNLNTSVNVASTTNLHAINSVANAVMGFFSITGSQGQMPSGIRAPIGGTYIHLMAWGSGISNDFRFAGASGTSLTHFVSFSFVASGGFLSIVERAHQMRINSADVGVGSITQLDGFNITYDALCGTFDR